MIIIGTKEDYRFLAGKCDGRCASGEWCVFADGRDYSECPLNNDENFIITRNTKHRFLEVEL